MVTDWGDRSQVHFAIWSVKGHFFDPAKKDPTKSGRSQIVPSKPPQEKGLIWDYVLIGFSFFSWLQIFWNFDFELVNTLMVPLWVIWQQPIIISWPSTSSPSWVSKFLVSVTENFHLKFLPRTPDLYLRSLLTNQESFLSLQESWIRTVLSNKWPSTFDLTQFWKTDSRSKYSLEVFLYTGQSNSISKFNS